MHYPGIVKVRINNQITAPQLRVIGASGDNLGVLTREQALALVVPGNGLDLIEIAPTANPPVARIMSFDKYRYEREKEEKKQRLAQKANAPKQVQISVREAQHDLLIKLRKLEGFLNDGHPVEIQVRLRGRERANKDWALQKLNEFLKLITVEHKQISPPKFGGKGVFTHIGPKTK